ncbi:hypothetical protein IE81DRAFT_170780 [Ceraceosorus guamensis]|uniref:Uncharacterized protein n=1 Tax=Ceraceosorus guamensis TaxID=1522189 RepID=A0A316VVL7_9BASI|nr:hypothetical protein IE81DRAFT_170780 [Ceraceosorus guamensis]PWN41530.1 hypothetical protein IE81DRAFT_170780 [Ceraceosorus guamensis]
MSIAAYKMRDRRELLAPKTHRISTLLQYTNRYFATLQPIPPHITVESSDSGDPAFATQSFSFSLSMIFARAPSSMTNKRSITPPGSSSSPPTLRRKRRKGEQGVEHLPEDIENEVAVVLERDYIRPLGSLVPSHSSLFNQVKQKSSEIATVTILLMHCVTTVTIPSPPEPCQDCVALLPPGPPSLKTFRIDGD